VNWTEILAAAGIPESPGRAEVAVAVAGGRRVQPQQLHAKKAPKKVKP
jgi:hypothetical protein